MEQNHSLFTNKSGSNFIDSMGDVDRIADELTSGLIPTSTDLGLSDFLNDITESGEIEADTLPGSYGAYYGDKNKLNDAVAPWPHIYTVLNENCFLGTDDFNAGTESSLKIVEKIINDHFKPIYKVSNDVNYIEFKLFNILRGTFIDDTIVGIAYTIQALLQGIPVIFGVNDLPYPTIDENDSSTNHYIIIVGMGNDGQNYFYGWDPACSHAHSYSLNDVTYQGGIASGNKLYLDMNWPGLLQANQAWENHYAKARQPYRVTKILRNANLF